MPQLQQAGISANWMYWDYQGIDGFPHTLVFDIDAMAWILDTYSELALSPLTHADNSGLGVQGVLLGAGQDAYQFVSEGELASADRAMNLWTGAVGGIGYQHLREITLEYSLTGTAAVSFAAPDVGNGSYAPNPITLIPTAGMLTKMRYPVSPAKWKLLQMGFSAALDAGLVVNIDGTALTVRDWGSSAGYKTIRPFTPSGGESSEP
jgi:hypothetical protein